MTVPTISTAANSPSVSLSTAKLIATRDREVVKVDSYGNVVPWDVSTASPSSTAQEPSTDSASCSSSRPRKVPMPVVFTSGFSTNPIVVHTTVNSSTQAVSVSSTTPSHSSTAPNRLSYSKTYSKKPTVITIPVTVTVDKFKVDHPKPVITNCSGNSLTATTTLLTGTGSAASSPAITLPTNPVTNVRTSKPTVKLNNVGQNQTPKSIVTTLAPATKLTSKFEVIKSSTGVPIKLISSGANTGKTLTKKIVQQIHQGSPSVSTQGPNLMRIISDQTGKLLKSGICFLNYCFSFLGYWN